MAATFKTPVSGNRRAPHDLPLPGPTNDLPPTNPKTPVKTRTVAAPKRISQTPQQAAAAAAAKLLAPQYAQANADAARQNAAIQAFTTAAMQQIGNLAPGIQDSYQHAADTQAGLVNAAAQSFKAANPNADIQGLLNAVGAPSAQSQQVANQLGNVFTGGAGVSQYTNTLPISALQANGLAAATLARLQPGNLALSGRQSLLSALQSQKDVRLKIAEQTPQLEQAWLNQFHTNQNQKNQLALEAQAAGLKQQNTTFNQNLSLTKLQQQQNQFISKQRQQINEFNAKQTTVNAKLALPNNSLSKTKGYVVDSSGNAILVNGKRQILPGFSVNAQGRVIKTPKVKTSTNPNYPNLTKAQVQHLRAGIALAFNGRKEQKDPNTGKVTTAALPPLGYWGAVNEAVSAGFSRAAAIKMANRFYMPGKRGRPKRG